MCRFENVTAPAGNLSPPRAKGELRAVFERAGARTHVARLFETGGLRLRCPRGGHGLEAVTINSAGGVVGGDAAVYDFAVGQGAQALITSQSADKIYRSDGATAQVEIALRLGAGARLDWIPQETILFDQAQLNRRLSVDMAEDASLILMESVVFGRLAMGETCVSGALRDSWRVRRGGKLLFAEELRLDGAIAATLERPACGAGARACGTLLHVAPDAESRLELFRATLERCDCVWGASAWDQMLFARLTSPSPELLRSAIGAALGFLRGADLPRVWQ